MDHTVRGFVQHDSEEGTQPKARQLTIILTSGDEDAGRRATLAFSAACSAQAMGVETLVYLVGDGVCWGLAEHADYFHVSGYPPLNQLIDDFVQAGGELYQCSTITNSVPQVQADENRKKLRQGVQLMGFASLIDQLTSSSAVTF